MTFLKIEKENQRQAKRMTQMTFSKIEDITQKKAITEVNAFKLSKSSKLIY